MACRMDNCERKPFYQHFFFFLKKAKQKKLEKKKNSLQLFFCFNLDEMLIWDGYSFSAAALKGECACGY